MSGVSTPAGYADTAKHGRVRFMTSLKSNGALRFQLLRGHRGGVVFGEADLRLASRDVR